ncbi:MAG TPA: hypothetical protein VE007_12535 [Thermoanaerobaculia bacterium]|nr:hypothetical protein [Thermoanaerobaculia bacterium]
MSKGLAIVITAVVGLFIGFLIGRTAPVPQPPPGPTPTVTPTPECPKKGNHTITVGPKAKDLSDECLTMKKSQIITWVALEENRALTIEFEQEIFEGMEPGHTENGKQLYVFKNCQNRRCSTTKTKSGVSTGVKYKYWQFLSDDPGGGNPDKADGWIVIDTGG